MNKEDIKMDWFVRYHYLFGRRYTRKQKDRFLASLATDIKHFREDLHLDTFTLHKREYRNFYVGDIKKAKTVVCTYYDTPAIHFSPYRFFNVEHRKKSTTQAIILLSTLFIVIGLLYTLLVAVPVFKTNRIVSVPFLSCVFLYILYFYFLNKITRGWPKRNNLIQNTSSVLLLLDIISSNQSKQVAYAFVDAGCTNNAGLERLLKKSKAQIYMLDSIGAEKPLRLVDPDSGKSTIVESPDIKRSSISVKNRLLYLISSDYNNSQFVLNRDDLNRKKLNYHNLHLAYHVLNKLMLVSY